MTAKLECAAALADRALAFTSLNKCRFIAQMAIIRHEERQCGVLAPLTNQHSAFIMNVRSERCLSANLTSFQEERVGLAYELVAQPRSANREN